MSERSELSVQDLTMRFGGLTAVRDFSLELAKGELVGLIGPNGAGKTTVFNVITGVTGPRQARCFWTAWTSPAGGLIESANRA